MLTIKTANMTIQREDNKLLSIVPSMEQVYMKFIDGIEITIPVKLTPEFSAKIQLASSSTAKNITIDFTNYNSPISFG